jgi:hypothetical protein
MAKIPNYKKDEETGAVIFQDANAYAQRQKVIAQTKLSTIVKKDEHKRINSMKKEIKDLKKLVYDMLENNPGETGTPPPEEDN